MTETFTDRIIDDLCHFCPPMFETSQCQSGPAGTARLKVQLGLGKRERGHVRASVRSLPGEKLFQSVISSSQD